MKRKILIFSHYFAPAFKGGGPIQSLRNLVDLLKDEFDVYIFCSATDLGEKKPMSEIIPNQWSDFALKVKVFYAYTWYNWGYIFNECCPDFIYINGLFSLPYNILPLWYAKNEKGIVVLAPRGMLHKGALSIKPFKKKLFLFCFKTFGFHTKVRWHATDNQEKNDIEKLFGSNRKVVVASNIPKSFLPLSNSKRKGIGELRIVFLSLITEKKNLHLVLEALKQVTTPICFHIYGPVKDEQYWKKCISLFTGQVHHIKYFGAIDPIKVQKLLSRYHVMILPTKGENFGHAIYESLSVGVPAIISQHTPWGYLQDYHAGITVKSDDLSDLANAIQVFIDLDQKGYSTYTEGAHNLAKDYFSKNDFKSQYQKLFS